MTTHYTVEQAIEFLASKDHHLTISDLIGLVRKEQLNPSFYYKGLLNEFCYSRPPHHSNRVGYALVGDYQVEFEGYIKPFDDSIIPQLVSTDKPASVRSLKIFNKLNYKLVNAPVGNYDYEPSFNPFEKASKFILEKPDLTVHEASHRCNYHVENGHIELNTSDFIFREQELIALLPHSLLHPEQINAAVKKHVRKTSQAKSGKRHAENYARKDKAIHLWQINSHLPFTYTSFADKYYVEIEASHDTVKRWISEYERERKAQKKKSA